MENSSRSMTLMLIRVRDKVIVTGSGALQNLRAMIFVQV